MIKSMNSFNSRQIVAICKDIVADLNRKYNLNVTLYFDRDIPFSKTFCSLDEKEIHLGIKDLDLRTKVRNPKNYTLKESFEIFQYVVHEFFHFEQELRILLFPLKDKLLTLDLITAEVFHDIYNENHTVSLIEVDVEDKSWKYLSDNLSKYVDIPQKKIESTLCSLFADPDNEFYTKVEPKFKDTFLMKFGFSSHKDISRLLFNLAVISRVSLRELSEDFIEKHELKYLLDGVTDPVEQLTTILSNTERGKLKIEELKEKYPEIVNLFRGDREPEQFFGIRN